MLLTSNRRVRHCLGGRQFLVAFIFWSGMVSNIGPTGILQRFLRFFSFSFPFLVSFCILKAFGRRVGGTIPGV